MLKCIRINIYFSQQKQRNIDFPCLKAAFFFHLLKSQLMFSVQSYFLSQKHGHSFSSKWANRWTPILPNILWLFSTENVGWGCLSVFVCVLSYFFLLWGNSLRRPDWLWIPDPQSQNSIFRNIEMYHHFYIYMYVCVVMCIYVWVCMLTHVCLCVYAFLEHIVFIQLI